MAEGIFYPAVSGDDAQVHYGYSTAGTTISIGQSGGGVVDAWYRFPNINIPLGSIINSAHLTLTYSYGSGAVPALIYGDAADNSVTPLNGGEYALIVFTTENVAWNIPSMAGAGTQCDTPDFKSVVQEIIDRPGWATDNALSIVIKDNGAARYSTRAFYAIDHGDGSQKPELHIEWAPPAAVPQVATWDLNDKGSNITLNTTMLTATHA